MRRLSIALFGPLEVRLGGELVGGFEYNKVRALLAYLAVEAGRPHTRATLCALLWPDQGDSAARQNLSQALTRLRQALGDKQAATPFLLATTDTVQLNPAAPVEVDVSRFSALVAEAEAHRHRAWRLCTPCAAALRAAIELYRGDFLAQFHVNDSAPFEEWALLLRERLLQRMMSALERLIAYAEWRGAHQQAAEDARRLVELDPLQEDAQRELIRLLALNGQRASALAQYASLERILAAELDAEPEPETTALVERIKRGVSLVGIEPPFAFSPPAPPSRLIGRDHDMQAVVERIRNDTVRALSLIGPPGVGKTRLALEAAHELRFDFEDGVCFVELAPVMDAALVPSVVAQELDAPERKGQTPTAALSAYLKHRHLLLVLDNFEHVLDAASLVAELLAACPALKILITSRAPLRIRAEEQRVLAPLALPVASFTADTVAQSPAVELFVERAQAVHPGFALTSNNAQAIAALCMRLEGLPLALELIAVRAKTLAPTELLRQLEQGLDALSHGTRDLPVRQRTLRSAIRWSFDRLTANEQRVFAQLGVFVGGCTAAAVQAVLGDDQPALPTLEALHEASLLWTQAIAHETRFTLLETIRDFALEQLAARNEVDVAHRRHALYFLALAEQAEPELIGPDQKRWFDRLGHEYANLRAALLWSQTHAIEISLRLAKALAPFWEVRGQAREGRSWLREALARGPHAAEDVRAWALVAAGRLAWRQGDIKEARELLSESQQLFLHIEEADGIALALVNLGTVELAQANYATAQTYFQESLSIAREAQHWYAEASALNGLGHVATRRGERTLARTYFEQSLALHQLHQDPRDSAGLTLNLGVIAYEAGDLEPARTYLERSLAIGRELDDRQLITISLVNLGNVLMAQGDFAAARERLEESIAIHRAQADTEGMAPALGTLGRVLRKLGDYAASRACQAEALQLRAEAGDARGVGVSLRNLADLDQSEHQADRAARLLGASEAIREAIQAPIHPSAQAEYEQLVNAVQASLSASAFSEAWRAGRALSLEQAVALALERTPNIAKSA